MRSGKKDGLKNNPIEINLTKKFFKKIGLHRSVLKKGGNAERFDENGDTNNDTEDVGNNDKSCRGGCDDESDVGSNYESYDDNKDQRSRANLSVFMMSMVVIVLMIKALVTVVSIIMLITILEKMGVVKMMLILKLMMVFMQIYLLDFP